MTDPRTPSTTCLTCRRTTAEASTGSTGSDRLLTPVELAERWGVSIGHLANLRSAGKWPTFVKLGHAVRYRMSDVLAVEDSGAVDPIEVPTLSAVKAG